MPSFTINTTAVSHQLIEGEVIAIHFLKGNYYSLIGTSALLWQGLEKSGSSESLDALFGPADPARLAQIVIFLKELRDEELIIETPEVPEIPQASSTPPDFTAPQFERYSDMQQLLLADPIHDVDTQGWPKMKDAN